MKLNVCWSKRRVLWGLIVGLGLCTPLGAQNGPVITEFLASNGSSLPLGEGEVLDEEGDSSDWIELFNPHEEAISLAQWYLTDDPCDLTQWQFPEMTLQPGQFLLVFASGKDRRDPDSPLHTNFRLGRSDGFLALVAPDGQSFGASYDYPIQFRDMAYGVSVSGSVEEELLIAEGAQARAWIPDSGALERSWTTPGFDDSAWQAGRTGVGYDYGGLIGLDTGAMRYAHTSVYVRIGFELSDLTDLSRLILRMKYEDGFAAYLNGVPVARANAPLEEYLSWDSRSTQQHSDGEAVVFEDFALPATSLDALVNGRNVLAIHGLNVNLSSSDLLVLPELRAQRLTEVDLDPVEGYLSPPSPGSANGPVSANLGPRVSQVKHEPPAPRTDQDLTVTARIGPTQAPVLYVILIPKVNFLDRLPGLPEEMIQMVDNGTGADAVAGDGVYTTTIPSALYDAGDMLRWSIQAYDGALGETRDPPLLPNIESAEYYGTVVQNPAIQSSLPVVQWFVEDVRASETDGGTRGSVYYLDEFYDNIVIHRRGGSTAGAKKTHFKFNFNPGHKFRYDPDEDRVNEFNLNSPYSDKAYLRQALAFEAYDWCGCPGSVSFPVVGYRNGEFFGVQIFIEEPEEELLQREGLDPDGALYKMYNTFTSSSSAEKKTRRWEGRQDLSDFINSINGSSGTAQHNHIFDQVNLPLTLNYLAGTVLVHQNDHPHKNHYLYRDSDGSGQWCFLPWDHDLSWGSNWTGSSYHDYIYAADDQVPGRPTAVKPSHPLVGKQDCQEWNRHWNRLIDALLENNTVREMYLRRLRTIMDDFLKAPGTRAEDLFIEQRIDELVALMYPDVQRDYQKWANPWTWGGQGGYARDQSFAQAIEILKTDYLAVRREHLFVTHHIDNVADYPIDGSYSAGIPSAQPAYPRIDFGRINYSPESGNQDEEYIELINPNGFAVDISGWRLTGGVDHQFLPGTVMVAGGSLYVSPSARAFLNRSVSPKRGEGRFVQGNYQGHLSSWGEALALRDDTGFIISTTSYTGRPSMQQLSLRVSEIMYHPADPGADEGLRADELEYIELANISNGPVLLTGVKFTRGIQFSFPAGLWVPAHGLVLVAKHPAALQQVANIPEGVAVLGPYLGQLSNGGETLKLEDYTNSTIQTFAYRDGWYADTDGVGHALVVLDPANTPLEAYSQKETWRASAHVGGTPGR